MNGLLGNIIHSWRVKNTNDPQLKAMEDYYKNHWGPGSSVDVNILQELINRQREVKGNRHIGFTGMPEFTSGDGTKGNPLKALEGGVGVTGFRGGSSPIDESSSYGKQSYLSGQMAGTSSELVGDKAVFNTDKGSYDFKTKWYHTKYKPI